MSNTDDWNKADTGTNSFGGEKAREHARQQDVLPDEHANSNARDARDEDIVASEFSGLDNDLVDLAAFDGTGNPGRPDDVHAAEKESEDRRNRSDREEGGGRTDGGSAKTPGDMTPADDRGRSYPKTDGNPHVTGDVRSS